MRLDARAKVGKVLLISSLLFPWRIRRAVYTTVFKWDIAPSAWIGRSVLSVGHLTLEDRAFIGHLNYCHNLDRIHIESGGRLGHANWVTGIPTARQVFAADRDRRAELHIGAEASITQRHFFECSNRVSIGRLTTVAGYQSQFITHSIDLREGRQRTTPIEIGERCFVGSRCTVLGGGVLPDESVLGAASLLRDSWEERGTLYSGVPATPIRQVSTDGAYFQRESGWVR